MSQIIQDIKIRPKFVRTGKYFQDDKEERDIYKIFVEYRGKTINFSFGNSLNDTWEHKKPDKNGLLETLASDYCYTKDYYPTFQDFASEFGYDEDSIKAEGIYKKCLENADKLHKLFTDADIEAIRKDLDL